MAGLLTVVGLLSSVASIQSAWFPAVGHRVTSYFASWGMTPSPKGDRLSVYVARFGDDELSTMARERVIASIRNELGPERVEVLPANMTLSLDPTVSDDAAFEKANRRARSLLRNKHGDLLIWGRVYAGPGMRPTLDLRFVSAETYQARNEPFGLTDKWMLEPAFGPEMGTALAAMASTLGAPVLQNGDDYVAQTLRPIAGKLSPLAQSLPASMRREDRGKLLTAYGFIRLAIGDLAGEPREMEEAIRALRRAAAEFPRDQTSSDWAAASNNLGIALTRIGQQDRASTQLEEAVEVFRSVLREPAEAGDREAWATATNNLGTALLHLGEREAGNARLVEAVVRFREVLSSTRESAPLLWAMAQQNLGLALTHLGQRDDNTGTLGEAVSAHREALVVLTRTNYPLGWAMAQDNLGATLSLLGTYEKSVPRFEEAIAAHRAALTELTRSLAPIEWAKCQNNLGIALMRLSDRRGDVESLEDAAVAHRSALLELKAERAPMEWARTEANLGNVLYRLSELEDGTASLEEAAAAYRAALSVFSVQPSAYYAQMAQERLDKTMVMLERRRR